MNDQTDPAEPTTPAEPTPPPADAGPPPTDQPLVEPTKSDSKTMAMLCHLLGIFIGFLGPLIIWLIKKDDDPFVDDQGKEALNFQITVLIAMVISAALICVVVGGFLMMAVAVCNIVFCIIGALKANEGVAYRYPFTLRLIK